MKAILKGGNIFDIQEVHYFNAHYSNIIYSSTYMVRLLNYKAMDLIIQIDYFLLLKKNLSLKKPD